MAKNYYDSALLEVSTVGLANTFRSLGQLMHLISDASVPAHVRNDPHSSGDPYEEWVEHNAGNIRKIDCNTFNVNKKIFEKGILGCFGTIADFCPLGH